MNRFILTAITLSFLFTGINVPVCSAADSGMLLPESIEALSKMAADKKTTTIFIEEEDPKRVTELVNTSNAEYAKQGWELFNITPYIKSGDFEGFFITYEKKLIIF